MHRTSGCLTSAPSEHLLVVVLMAFSGGSSPLMCAHTSSDSTGPRSILWLSGLSSDFNTHRLIEGAGIFSTMSGFPVPGMWSVEKESWPLGSTAPVLWGPHPSSHMPQAGGFLSLLVSQITPGRVLEKFIISLYLLMLAEDQDPVGT